MAEAVLDPFIVRLQSDRITVQVADNETSETISEEQIKYAYSLVEAVYADPNDSQVLKKFGLWLYRQLPLEPKDPFASAPVFVITNRDIWEPIPWEFLFDGSQFLMERLGGQFQVATGNKKPGAKARPLGRLDRLKIVLVSTDFTDYKRRDELIAMLQASPGFAHLQGESPAAVRETILGIKPDVVILDAVSSSDLIAGSGSSIPVTETVAQNKLVEAGKENTGPTSWQEVTTDYLLAGSGPPLILAPSGEHFALDALEAGADQVVLSSRYPIDEEDYYAFANALIQKLSADRSIDSCFSDAVLEWTEMPHQTMRIPLIYNRFPAGQQPPGLHQKTAGQAERRPEKTIEDKPAGQTEPFSEAPIKDEPAIQTTDIQPAARPAPDLRTASELSSYRSDVAATKDRMNVTSDVENLCQVIMARQWKPPLSIGLFGNWGSGKTSFINLMWQMIEATARRARQSPDGAFVSNVIQIEFNAWHYLDANLWANLVVRILDGIHRAVFERERDEAEKDEFRQIIAHLNVLQEEVEKSEGQRRQLQSSVSQIDSQIQTKRSEQETALGMLAALRAAISDSDNAIAREVDDITNNLRQAADKLGLPSDLSLSEALSRARKLMGIGARLGQSWEFMNKSRLGWLVLPLALVIFIFGIQPDLSWISQLPAVQKTVTTLATLAAFFVSWTQTLAPQFNRIKLGLDAVETARTKVENIRRSWLEAKQLKLADLENERAAAVSEISALETRKFELLKEQKQLEERLEQLMQGLGLEEFLLSRAGSAEYQEQLGIIALIHQDMKELQRKLRAGLKVEIDGKMETKRYDRVILYLDDLDRCTPMRVVEVLQAVHLLLSIPLFVVVVAADPRWLLQSLLTHYQDLLHTGIDIEDFEWGVTPQNYLEKIFQIPFTLPPMASRDFDQYVTDLFREDSQEPEVDQTEVQYRELQNEVEYLEIKTRRLEQQAPPEPEAASSGDSPTAEIADDAQPQMAAAQLRKERARLSQMRQNLRKVSRELKIKQQKALATVPTFDSSPKALNVPEGEQQFVKQLLPLLTTPRTTKRLLNVYRLIRVSLDDKDIEAFEKEQYQSVLVLLAVMYSFPTIAAEFFTGIRSTRESTIHDYIKQMSNKSKNGDWQRLNRGIKKITCIQNIDVYRRWFEVVGRFSFQVGHKLLHEQ